MPGENDTRGTIQSDRRVFAIIEALRELGEAGVTELSEQVGLHKSSTHKHLKTLKQMGYVVSQNGVYRLSFKLLQFGGELRDQTYLCQLARQYVHDLAEESDELVSFAIKEQDFGVFTHLHNDPYGLRKTTPLGRTFELHTNAAGKSILSELPEAQVRSIIENSGLSQETAETISSEAVLFDELEQIRDQGYALSSEERVKGVEAIATAVHDPKTGLHGALSISMPVDRRSGASVHTEFSDRLIETANNLELQARYRS